MAGRRPSSVRSGGSKAASVIHATDTTHMHDDPGRHDAMSQLHRKLGAHKSKVVVAELPHIEQTLPNPTVLSSSEHDDAVLHLHDKLSEHKSKVVVAKPAEVLSMATMREASKGRAAEVALEATSVTPMPCCEQARDVNGDAVAQLHDKLRAHKSKVVDNFVAGAAAVVNATSPTSPTSAAPEPKTEAGSEAVSEAESESVLQVGEAHGDVARQPSLSEVQASRRPSQSRLAPPRRSSTRSSRSGWRPSLASEFVLADQLALQVRSLCPYSRSCLLRIRGSESRDGREARACVVSERTCAVATIIAPQQQEKSRHCAIINYCSRTNRTW